MNALPESMRAVVHQGDGINVKVEQRPVPRPSDSDVLVRVRCVGVNPTDAKGAAHRHAKGVRSGCDFAGEVAALGPDVPKGAWSDGDRVGGFVAGGMSETNGAYADFVLVPYDHLFRIPSKLSFAAAASIPIPAYTAVQALYLRLGLPEPDVETATRATEGPWLLVWSASTAVGQYAVQLGALSGYRIVATASPERHDHVKSLGASLVFDYKDADVINEIKRATGDDVTRALDCVGGEGMDHCVRAMSAKGGKACSILFFDRDKLPRQDVEAIHTLAYSYLFRDGNVKFAGMTIPAPPHEHDHYVKWLGKLPAFFERGKIQPLPTKSFGGLEDMPSAFRAVLEGRNRGFKIVLEVS